MFQVDVSYPTKDEEIQIVNQMTTAYRPTLRKVLSPDRILELQDLVLRVPAAPHVVQHAVALCRSTRPAAPSAPDFIKKYVSCGAGAGVMVEGAFAGMRHDPNAGTSIEFAEHKEYAPGDDIRHLDWKAVGRVDRYYIKRFEDETAMRTYLLVDASASMGYGRRGVSKLDYAGYLAAALGYLLAQQGDPAGLVIFDEKTRQYLPPRSRGGHVRDLLLALEGA